MTDLAPDLDQRLKFTPKPDLPPRQILQECQGG